MNNLFRATAKQWKNTIERKRVSKMFADGKTIHKIANECKIEECVVETHIRHEFVRLGMIRKSNSSRNVKSIELLNDGKA